MTPIRAPTVDRAGSFQVDVDVLRHEYDEIDVVIEDLENTLRGAWGVPHYPIDPDAFPQVYGVALDYAPLGSGGLGKLFVTYHASGLTDNPMQNPLRRYTLLTIAER